MKSFERFVSSVVVYSTCIDLINITFKVHTYTKQDYSVVLVCLWFVGLNYPAVLVCVLYGKMGVEN